MRRVWRWAGGVLAALALAGVAAAFVLPGRQVLSADVWIEADAATVMPWLDGPRAWMAWHPWGPHRYPEMQRHFAGPVRGAGAVWQWREGRLSGEVEITAVEDGRRVRYRNVAARGRYRGDCSMSLDAEESGTRVVWRCEGRTGHNPLARLMMWANAGRMQRGMSGGLAKLKALVEQRTGGRNDVG